MSTDAHSHKNADKPHTHLKGGIRWIVRFVVDAALATSAVAAAHGLLGVTHWQEWTAYPLVGGAMALCTRGADLLWNASASHLIPQTETVKRLILRIPFSFFPGGMGYVIGMLAAKRMFLIGFYDAPVRPLFLLGGVLGSILWAGSALFEHRLGRDHPGRFT